MSSLQNLTDQHFVLNGTTMKCVINNAPVFVLFKDNSSICNQVHSILHLLSNTEKRIVWAICDIVRNRNVITKSKYSPSTTITHVPLGILYINGNPVLKYTKNFDEHNIKNNILRYIQQSGYVPPQRAQPPVQQYMSSRDGINNFHQPPQASPPQAPPPQPNNPNLPSPQYVSSRAHNKPWEAVVPGNFAQ